MVTLAQYVSVVLTQIIHVPSHMLTVEQFHIIIGSPPMND